MRIGARRLGILVLILGGSSCMSGGSAPARAPVDTLAVVTPEERVVQAQLNAYNRHDVDAFMATMAPDIRLYQFPDSLLNAGQEEVRGVYARGFSKAPQIHAELVQRLVQGRFVIDEEITTGLPGKGPQKGVAIYEVKDGLISRVWFMD